MTTKALKHVQTTYEEYGKTDPLYAVLSREGTENKSWDVDEFMATGRQEIADAMKHLAKLDVHVNRNRALDFGCGVGRLTQALCEEFEEAVGVDISYSMIEIAKSYNVFGDRCEYRVNTTDDLAKFDDACFDFVYSNISLQHSPPEASSNYIAEFFRVLRSGGVGVFQIPSGPHHIPGSFGAKMYSIRRGPLRRLWKRIRGLPPVEIHYLNQAVVEEIIQTSGGQLIDATQQGSVRGPRVSMLYCAVRK